MKNRMVGSIIFLIFLIGAGSCTGKSETAEINNYLNGIQQFGFSGAVAVCKNDSPVLARGVGYANNNQARPVTTSSLFDIGSMTKVFTSLSTMILIDSLNLSLSESLEHLLPDCPEDKKEITVEQLLTHTAGLARYASHMGVEDTTSRDVFIEQVMASELLSPPGKEYSYSDVGFDLLAAIIELKSGEKYEKFAADHIFKVLKMQRTGYWPIAKVDSNEVMWAYRGGFGSTSIDDSAFVSRPTWMNKGSGGIVTCLDDMVKFSRAVNDRQLLAPNLWNSVFTPRASRSGNGWYGLGWMIDVMESGDTVCWHSGDIDGYKATIRRYPQTNNTLVILSNVFGWERTVDQQIPSLLGGSHLRLPSIMAGADKLPAKEAAGTYRFGAGDSIVIAEAEGALQIDMYNQAAINLICGLQEDERADYAELNQAASEIFAGFSKGETAGLEARLRDRDLKAGMANRALKWWESLNSRYGTINEVDIIGSIPAQDYTDITFLHLMHDSGHVTAFRIVWRYGKVVTIGTGIDLPSAVAVAVDKDELATFNLLSGEASTLKLIKNNSGQVSGLELKGPNGNSVTGSRMQ